MKASTIQDALNAGEFSPLTQARVRFEKYKNGLATCVNMIPIVQGGATRRTGSYFTSAVKDSSKATRLIPFEFSTTQAYVLEFGDLYIRFYKDRGQVQTSSVTAWLTGTAYVVGDLRTNAGTTYYCTTAHTSGTFATDLAAGKWYAQTSTIYEIPTPYPASILFDLKFTQSADVLYITHPAYATRKLSRTGHTAWTLEAIDFIDGPYLATNTSATTLTLSATTGSVTVTSSTNTFASTDIGRSIRFKSGGTTWGWLKITAYSSATSVTADVRRSPNAGTASVDWRLGTWSGTTGYPSCVMFFEDRLFFAGSPSNPQRIDGSKSSSYETFSPTGDTGTVTDDSAIAVTLNASDVNVIRWMQDDEKGLLVGTVGGEWLVRPSSLSEALTPTNVTAKRSTSFGTANIQAKKTGKACIYVQRAGRKVRELAYVYEVDGFRAPDMTVLSEHITKGGLVEFDYQQEPFSIIWFVRADGVLVGMTYERDQDVVGWHRHIIGGVFGTGSAVVESIAVIPTPDTTADEVWLIVKRTIDGNTKRYIEYITQRFDDDDTEDAFFVDCGLTYSGAAADVISGLDHLEGQTVQILADGAVHPNRVVTSGDVTLNAEYSKVHIGLGYNSDIKTLRLEAGSADGTSQGKTKRITRVDVRLYKTLGLKYGKDESHLDTVTFRTSADDMNAPPVLFTGDKAFVWNSGYDIEGQMYFRQDQPLPMTILSIAPQVVTQDR